MHSMYIAILKGKWHVSNHVYEKRSYIECHISKGIYVNEVNIKPSRYCRKVKEVCDKTEFVSVIVC